MFGRLPSLSALRTFEAAARLGSFKAAAEELSVTSTAVSHQVRSLEQQMGIALFDRSVRKVTLTPSGMRLSGDLHGALLSIASAVEREIEEEAIITVSTTPAFAALWLVPRIADFETQFSSYKIRLEAGVGPVDLKRQRQVDVAIRYAASTMDGLCASALPQERFFAYGAPAYLEKQSEGLLPVLLETEWERVALPHISWWEWLRLSGQSAEQRSFRQMSQEHHVIQCALAGQGLVLASNQLVTDYVASDMLRVHQPDISLAGESYTLLSTKDKSQQRKVMTFNGWVAQQFSGTF